MDKAVMDVRGELTGWAKDTAGHMDVAVSDGANAGGVVRGRTFASSKTVTMIGHLQNSMFMQGCSIPPKHLIKVVLEPAPDNFLLMAAAGKKYEMHIETAELHVVRQHTAPSLVHAVTNLTAKRNLKLNYRRTEVTGINIRGLMSEKVTLFSDTTALPDRLLIGITTNKAYAGQIQSNPYNFVTLDYAVLQLTVDGHNFPSNPYKPDFGNKNDYYPLYDCLLHEFNADKANHMINVTPTEYFRGYTLYPFRLTPRSCCGDVLGETKSGAVILELTKTTQSAEQLTLIVLSEYRSEYEISPVGGSAQLAQPQQ
jgi:hypothetical protein